jgi:hypothetical protein
LVYITYVIKSLGWISNSIGIKGNNKAMLAKSGWKLTSYGITMASCINLELKFIANQNWITCGSKRKIGSIPKK